MKRLKIGKAFTLMESGPVVLVTTGHWNYSFAALRRTPECVIAISTVDMLDKVVDIVKRHSIFVLEGVAAHIDPSRKEKRAVHAVGDGTFIVDGRKLSRRRMMASRIPSGI